MHRSEALAVVAGEPCSASSAVQGDEVWWRLKCKNLDHEGRPVNNTGTGWAHCGQTLQDGPR